MLVSADTNISGGLGPLSWLVGLNLPSESLQRIGWELSSFRAGWLSLVTMRRWRTFWLAGPRLWLFLGGPVQPRKPELRPGLLARLLGTWRKVSPALRGDGCLSIKGRTIETPIGLCAELKPACASLDHSFLFYLSLIDFWHLAQDIIMILFTMCFKSPVWFYLLLQIFSSLWSLIQLFQSFGLTLLKTMCFIQSPQFRQCAVLAHIYQLPALPEYSTTFDSCIKKAIPLSSRMGNS